METFSRCWPFVRGIHRSPVNSPHKGQWRGALMFSLISTGTNGWVNGREPGDLRRHRAHYDVIAMLTLNSQLPNTSLTAPSQPFFNQYENFLICMDTVGKQLAVTAPHFRHAWEGGHFQKPKTSRITEDQKIQDLGLWVSPLVKIDLMGFGVFFLFFNFSWLSDAI